MLRAPSDTAGTTATVERSVSGEVCDVTRPTSLLLGASRVDLWRRTSERLSSIPAPPPARPAPRLPPPPPLSIVACVRQRDRLVTIDDRANTTAGSRRTSSAADGRGRRPARDVGLLLKSNSVA